MAYQQVPNTAQINVVYTLTGQTLINTYHAEAPAGYNQAALDALAIAIDAGPIASMKADQSSSIQYVRTDVRGLDLEYDLTSTANANAGTGTVFNTVLPAHLAFAVRKLSGFTGRSSRGRVYICGIPVNYLSTTSGEQSQISLAAANAYKGHVDSVRSTIEGIAVWNAVIVSRWHNGAKRATGLTFRWTSTDYSDRVFDTQRKRRPL